MHEQTSTTATTNTILAKVATRVLTAFPDTLPRGEWIGNPVRKEISSLQPTLLSRIDRDRPPRILILGGSLGATSINKKIPQALSAVEKNKNPKIRHRPGKATPKKTSK